MSFFGVVRDVPRTVRLLAFGAFLNGVVSFTFIYLFVYLTGPRGLSVPQAGCRRGHRRRRPGRGELHRRLVQ